MHHIAACTASNIIVLCTPGGQPTLDVFTTLYKAGALTDKTVIDLTNPFSLDHLKSTSGGEMLQQISGPAVKVVKTLNTIGHNMYSTPSVGGQKADMFVAGDNAEAKNDVVKLV